MALIEIRDLTYQYPITDHPALQNLDLSINQGEFAAVIGQNGSGKSTLCYTLSGFIPHFFRGDLQGTVEIAGTSTVESSLNEWVLKVGLVFQNPFNQISGSKFTVYEEVAFGLENLGTPRDEMKQRVEDILQRTGIADLADRSPYALSGGQQQRVALASILVMKPEVLVLDEPTSQLDPIGTRQVFQVIKTMSEGGMTVIMAEHKLEWIAEFADRVIVLDKGKIVQEGSPEEVLTSSHLQDHGLASSRYTSVARKAKQLGLWPRGTPLPVRLEDARLGFQRILDEN